jgi:hypothetical protein
MTTTKPLEKGALMKLRSFLLGSALVLLASGAAAQQPAVGKWNATVETPGGPFTLVFDFLVDAAGTLTGTLTMDFLGSIPIKEGVAKGNDVSFKLTIEGAPNGPMTIGYTGTVKGDELALTSKLEGAPPEGTPPEQSFTAKRAK